MRKALLGVLLAGVCTTLAWAGRDEYCVVKIYDHAKEMSMQAMSAEDLAVLEEEIKVEARLHSKAIALAGKEWQKKEDVKGKMFPRSCAAPRKVTVTGKFPDLQEAEEYISEIEERAAVKKIRAVEREKEMAKRLKTPAYAKKSGKGETKIDTRALIHEQARALYAAKLEELVSQKRKSEAEAAAKD